MNAKLDSPFRCFNSSPEVIRLVVMMYMRFPLSFRNAEALLFERGIDLCHETVWFWWNRFGAMFAGYIRRQRVRAMRGARHWRWHLDEIYVKISGEMHYVCRAVDHQGEILESFVTKTRDKAAALTSMKKALRRHGTPEVITIDGLASYRAAMKDLENAEKQGIGRWTKNRIEDSHPPFRRRERAMLRFRQMKSHRSLPASTQISTTTSITNANSSFVRDKKQDAWQPLPGGKSSSPRPSKIRESVGYPEQVRITSIEPSVTVLQLPWQYPFVW